jgi:hypothetical protein
MRADYNAPLNGPVDMGRGVKLSDSVRSEPRACI